MSVRRRAPWFARAHCRDQPLELFFPAVEADAGAAVALCAECLVRVDCLTHALDRPELTGIWGGVTEKARAKLRRSARRQALHLELVAGNYR